MLTVVRHLYYIYIILIHLAFISVVNAQSTATLSVARRLLVATSDGTVALFAGGRTGTNGTESNVVDIYNGGIWSTATLSVARYGLAATSVGTVALFGGGYAGTNGTESNVVDIYNGGIWSTATLSVARYALAATSVETVALFGGGYTGTESNVVDIYNGGIWSTATLSVARYSLAATSDGTVALFAGGYNFFELNVVDIYNGGIWSTATLSVARYGLAATNVGTIAFFGGGVSDFFYLNISKVVDICNGGIWSTATLSVDRSYLAATSIGALAFFGGNGTDSNVVDIINGGTPVPSSPTTLIPTSTVTPTSPPTTSTVSPTLTTAPTMLICTGLWVPNAIPGGKSSLCSACTNGTLLLTRYVSPDPQCANIPNLNFTSCSFPCLGNNTQANDTSVSSVLSENNYFQNLLSTLNIYIQFNISSIGGNIVQVTFFPCDATLNMTYFSTVISTLMRDVFIGQNLPISTNIPECKVYIGSVSIKPDNFNYLVSLLIVIPLLLLFLLKYYFGSVLHQLPKEVSWSFLDKLTHPWRWTDRIEYYVREYEKNSDEWKRVQNMLIDHFDSANLYPLKIFAIYNPTLTNSFVNQWNIYSNRKRDSPDIFFANHYGKNVQKIWVMEQYTHLCSRFSWNEKLHLPLIPALHGTAEKIAQTGFAALASLDAGYFGRGIYFTTYMLYTLPYSCAKQNPSVIVSYLNPGNVFPVTEDHKGEKKLIGNPLTAGFNSHFILTNKEGSVYSQDQDQGDIYNEIVVDQESQILPAFIVTLEGDTCTRRYLEWQREIPTLLDAVTYREKNKETSVEQQPFSPKKNQKFEVV